MQETPPAAPASGGRRRPRRGLAKEPDERYATCAELIDAAPRALRLRRAARRAPARRRRSARSRDPRRRRRRRGRGGRGRRDRADAATRPRRLAPTASGIAVLRRRDGPLRVADRGRDGAEQRRRRRGRGLGAQHRAADRDAHRPRTHEVRDGASRPAASRATSPPGAGAVWIGNGGGAARQLDAWRSPASTPHDDGDPHDPAARRAGEALAERRLPRDRRRRRRGVGAQPRPTRSRASTRDTGRRRRDDRADASTIAAGDAGVVVHRPGIAAT